MTLKALYTRIRQFVGSFDGTRRDRELVQELEAHLQMHIADNVRAGMTFAAARRDALIKLGGFQQTLERCRDVETGSA
jgi:hypothetical protein